MHNYVTKITTLVAAREAAGNPLPHDFINTEVFHDQWCRCFRGIGECNCNPDIIFHTEETTNEQKAATFIRLHGGNTGEA